MDYAERAIYIREKKERMAKMTLEERYDSSLIPSAALQVLIGVQSEAKTALKFALTKL